MADRELDLVLYGATGFTGGLTAEYLAAHAPDTLRWAIAGRNARKLAEVRERLVAINPKLADLTLIAADSTDPESMTALATSTKALITTVGPYATYGEPLAAACAAAGTNYGDLTGEPEFVDRIWLRYNDLALKSGARLVHCCGFDSIPHDLGAYFTVLQLPEGVPVQIDGFVRVRGEFSGGTMSSALTGMAEAPKLLKAAKQRRAKEAKPPGRRARVRLLKPGHEDDLGWHMPLPTIDAQVVQRSALAIDRYGPEFVYSHNMTAHKPFTLPGMAAATPFVFVAAQIPPLRKKIISRRPPGEGPSPETRAKSSFSVNFIGRAGGEEVRTIIAGGDPGYDETAKMLAESGMALALDELPDRAGQLTPVAAMGDALLDRLPAAGIEIRKL